MRQIFWGSGTEFPDDLQSAMDKVTLDVMELGPGEKAAMSLIMPAEFGIIFDPVTHTAVFLDVAGEPTTERRSLSVVLSEAAAHSATHRPRPGPIRIAVENKSGRRTIPGLWIHNAEMTALMNRRRPFLTATRVLSNQTFRDLYRNATLDPEQRFKITNLTILFTDLMGSTALYDRVGDLAAFDLVRHHFSALLTAVAAEGGAVVKTIGDAVMATFPAPDRAIRAAMQMREEMRKINGTRGNQDLALNIGLHEGPCLAVTLNDRQDYFGQTVNIASRIQGLADPTAILATQPIVENAEVARLVRSRLSRRPANRRCAESAKRSRSTRFANAKPRRRHSPAPFRFAGKATPPPTLWGGWEGSRAAPSHLGRQCARSEEIQGNVWRLDRRVASLLAMTIASERGMLRRPLNRRSALGDQLSRAKNLVARAV